MLIVFDLDGTLIDSAEDLAISVNATLEHLGMPTLHADVIQSYVGNGAPVLMRRAIGPEASEDTYESGLAFFLRYYRHHSLQHTQLYPGIADLLQELHMANHRLAVLTNKPAKISRDILAGLNVQQYFGHIYGGDTLPVKKPDPAGLLGIMREAGGSEQDTLLVGDSSVDVQTARNASVRCCGVLWGFQPKAIQSSMPDIIINNPQQLLAYL